MRLLGASTCGVAFAILLGSVLQGCATVSDSGVSARRSSAVDRDVVARALERIGKGPLQQDEAPGYFLIAEQLYFERNLEVAGKVFAAVFEVAPTLVCGMRLSEIYIVSGRTVEAERTVNKLAVLFPQSSEVPLALSRVLISEGKNDEALQVLKDAYAQQSDKDELGMNQVELLLRMGRRAEVVSLLEKAMKEPTVSSFMLEKMAEIHLQDKKTAEAKKVLERLLHLYPEDVEGWTLAGFVAVEEKDFKRAEQCFREAYLKQPENDTLARYYVTQLLRQEKFQESRRLLLRLEAVTQGKNTLDPELTFQLALVLFKLEDYAGARARFLGLSKMGDEVGKAFFYAAQCDEMLKNSVGALDSYSKIPAESPYRMQGIQRTVFLYLERGDFEKARQSVAGFSLGQDSEESDYAFLAAVYARLKDYKKAIETAKTGLAKFPNSSDLATSAATWLEFTDSREAAVKAVEAVVAKFPKHAAALNYLAYSLAENGIRLDSALQFAQKAVALEPKNGFYLDTLGWVMFRKGLHAQAQGMLERALAAEPDEPVILEHLGENALSDKDFSRALKHFEAAEQKFASQPEWKMTGDKEWQDSRKRVNIRIQELRQKALSK